MDESDGYGVDAPKWEGRVCLGCGGTGIAAFYPASPQAPYEYTCPACNGHGREPS